MHKKQYSPKEIAAFSGLLKLAASGRSFSTIKVQDIAKAADIGKGTLYEYFSSKEEILCCTMLYVLEQIADWVEAQAKKQASLYACLDEFFDVLEQETFMPLTALPMLGSFLSYEQRAQLNTCGSDEARELLLHMRRCAEQIFSAGRKNGEIASELEDTFCTYTILSALGGYAAALEKMPCSQETAHAAVCRRMAQQLTIRALHPS